MTNNKLSKLSIDKEKIDKANHDELIDMATEMFARFYWDYWHWINKKGEYKDYK